MLDLGSDEFHFWQIAWFCFWQRVDEDSQRAFQTIEGLTRDRL